MTVGSDFEAFVRLARARLLRAYIGAYGVDRASDAAAEALAWAWEHREHLASMANPIGYLYRVGQSRSRPPRVATLPAPDDLDLPEVEPGLVPALQALPAQQRTAVWLTHACGWSHRDVADATGIGTSTVATHVSRGLETLRAALEVDTQG